MLIDIHEVKSKNQKVLYSLVMDMVATNLLGGVFVRGFMAGGY